MKLDEYVTLGRSGLRVSPLCLGTMTFGEDWGWGSPVDESRAILETYVDRGGNFIDTANIYTKGHSEAIIGDCLCGDAFQRDRLVIATKFMGNMYPGNPNGGGAGRLAIIEAVEHSLRRLRTDRIDLLWAHFHDPHTPIDEMMRTLDDLVRSGKVRYIGLSDHPAWKCAQAQYEARIHGWEPIVALQIEYSLAQRTVEAELMPMAAELGMGVTPWSPLKGGILTGKYRRGAAAPDEGRGAAWERQIDDKTYDLIETLVAIAEKTGATPAQVALRWVQDRCGVTSTIIGARTMNQLEANLGALEIEISDEDRAALDEASKPTLPFPAEFLDTVKTAIHNGSSINGDRRDRWPMSPEGDDDRW